MDGYMGVSGRWKGEVKRGNGQRLTNISDPLLHLRIRRHPNQQLKLGVRGSKPEDGDKA